MFRLLCMGIGYLIGCISTGFIVGKFTKTDLRKKGSGNIGTTNAFRVIGFRGGAATFLGDVLKAVLAFIIAYELFRENAVVAGFYAATGAILGHDFPFYLKFKGGKGVAATIGMTICLGVVASPLFAAVTLGIGVLAVLITGCISAGSIAFAIAIPIVAFFRGMPLEIVVVMTGLGILALWKHKENMKRLRAGTESKFSFRKSV